MPYYEVIREPGGLMHSVFHVGNVGELFDPTSSERGIANPLGRWINVSIWNRLASRLWQFTCANQSKSFLVLFLLPILSLLFAQLLHKTLNNFPALRSLGDVDVLARIHGMVV